MKRTKKKEKPTAILTADWHLREDTPICRTDDYMQTQTSKLNFISNLQNTYNCPVWHAGDLFHHWKPSPYLLYMTVLHLPENFFTIYGNHDLPQNNLILWQKSGIAVLEAAEAIQVPQESHWGEEPEIGSFLIPGLYERRVLLWHKMVWDGKTKPYPGCSESPATELLKKYPEFDLIVTGDNHQTFMAEYEGRLLVNPGSLMRLTADQIDHKPCVFLWYAKSNTVKKIPIPHDKNVISRVYLDRKEKHNERINAFIEKLNTDWTVEVSFQENLKRFLKINKIKPQIEQIIYNSLEGGE